MAVTTAGVGVGAIGVDVVSLRCVLVSLAAPGRLSTSRRRAVDEQPTATLLLAR